MKIGIYGGTFNPAHFGHVGLARRAIAELGLDRLVVVPTNVSPFKADDGVPELRDLELLKAIFADVPKAVVDDREIRRGGISYAIDTVSELAAENPGAELVFVTGEDCVADLPKWKEYERLKTLCTFVALPRTAESSTEIRGLFERNRVRLSTDEKIVGAVKAGLVRKNGFCPCRLQKAPEFFCPCDEFKSQLRDPAYHGLCHCRLYQKP